MMAMRPLLLLLMAPAALTRARLLGLSLVVMSLVRTSPFLATSPSTRTC